MASLEQLQDQVAQLADGFRKLEARVAALEGERTQPSATEEPAGGDALTRAPSFADWPRRIAVVSFALGGALILRVATQQDLLDHTTGTWLGLIYAALLVATPILPGQLGRRYPLLPYCGAVLPALIVLESVLRFDQLSPALAAIALHGTALLGAVTAVQGRLGRLAGIALASAIAASLGLLTRPAALPWCAYGVLLEVVAAHELVRRRNWTVLRPLVVIPTALFLGAALLYGGQRPAYVAVLPHVGLAIGGTWLVVLTAHLGWLRRQRVATAGWLPAVSLWGVLLGIWIAPDVTPYVAVGLASLLLALAIAAIRRGRGVGVPGLYTASALLLAGAAIALPGRSVALAIWSFAAAWMARRLQQVPLAVLAALLALAAAGTQLFDGRLYAARPTWSPEYFTGLATLAILLAQFVQFRARPTEPADFPATRASALVSLVGGVIGFFCAARVVLALCAPRDDVYQLLQTALLGAFSLAALGLARWGRAGIPAWLGVLVLVLLVARVAFLDLFLLQGIPLLLSVITLGIASAFASFALKNKSEEQPGALPPD